MQFLVGAFEAKTHFSELLERVGHGEEIIITKRGKPVARFSPMESMTNNDQAIAAAKK